jgi:hypothetical protein
MVRTTKVGGELILVIAQGSSRWNAVFGSTPFLEEVALPGTQSIKRSWNMPEKALLEVAGELGLVLERSFSGSRTIPIGGTTLPWGSPGFSTYVFKVT